MPRANRIRHALQALGGSGTTSDITRMTGADPATISAQLAGMVNRGDVCRAGTTTIRVDRGRYGRRAVTVTVTVWKLT